MNKQTRQRIVYGVFVAAVVLGLYMRPWQRPGQDATVTANQSIASTATAAASGAESQIASAAVATATPVVFAAEWPADPFRGSDDHHAAATPAADANIQPSKPAWALQGIMTVDGERVCVINGQTEKIGATIGGWRVDRIDNDAVWMARGSEKMQLNLP